MDQRAIIYAIEQITYKPGVTIKGIWRPDRELVMVSVVMSDQTDSEAQNGNTDEVTQNFVWFDPDYGLTLGEVLATVRELVCSLEMHEVDEFLRYDGYPFVEPHPELHQRGVIEKLKVGEPYGTTD